MIKFAFQTLTVRKANFFYLFILSIFLVACSNLSSNGSKLPFSEGNLNEVVIVVDNNLWNGEIGDSIREKLAYPIDGLPNEETALLLKQFSPKIIDNSLKRARNLVIIEKGDENEFIHVENEFATPQNVFYFKGETIHDILELISQHGDFVENSIRFYELLEIQSKMALSPFNDNHIQKSFNISLLVPDKYNYVLTTKNFIWLKRDTSVGSNSIMVYEIPASRFNNSNDLIQDFVEIRDSITQKYVKGVADSSYMHINHSYSPFAQKVFIQEGLDSYEFRGSWDLTNDYMEGPYLCYLFHDAKNNRYLFVDGFVYNPTQPNRDYIFEIEAIIKSIHFN
jgi:hypothetical protein